MAEDCFSAVVLGLHLRAPEPLLQANWHPALSPSVVHHQGQAPRGALEIPRPIETWRWTHVICSVEGSKLPWKQIELFVNCKFLSAKHVDRFDLSRLYLYPLYVSPLLVIVITNYQLAELTKTRRHGAVFPAQWSFKW